MKQLLAILLFLMAIVPVSAFPNDNKFSNGQDAVLLVNVAPGSVWTVNMAVQNYGNPQDIIYIAILTVGQPTNNIGPAPWTGSIPGYCSPNCLGFSWVFVYNFGTVSGKTTLPGFSFDYPNPPGSAGNVVHWLTYVYDRGGPGVKISGEGSFNF